MVSLGVGIGLTAIKRRIAVSVSANIGFAQGSVDNEFTGTSDQHGTLYYMSGPNAIRSAAQVKSATGAEDHGSAFVNAGSFEFSLDLTNTPTYVDRWLHLVLENDNGFSNVAVVQFQINDPIPWVVEEDGTITSWPTFDNTPWSISAPGSTVRILSYPQEIV